MKSLVKVLITALTLGLMASVSTLHAQDGGKKGGRGRMSPEQRIAAIEEAVGSLSADQKTKITAILEKSAKDMMALPQEERREKGREIMMATNKDIRAVLTAEQQKKFDEMPMGGPGGGRGKKKQN
jgi:Spy/CpxP family protein refolding chaperone